MLSIVSSITSFIEIRDVSYRCNFFVPSAVLQILKNRRSPHSPIETIHISVDFEAKHPDQETLRAELGRVLHEMGFAPTHFASKFMLDVWLLSIFDVRLNKKPLTHDMEGIVRRALLTKFFESVAIELHKHDLQIECYVKQLINAHDTLLDATVAEETIQTVNILIFTRLMFVWNEFFNGFQRSNKYR